MAKKVDDDQDIDIEATISEAMAESYDAELTAILREALTSPTPPTAEVAEFIATVETGTP